MSNKDDKNKILCYAGRFPTRGSGETSQRGATPTCGGTLQSVGSRFSYLSNAARLGLCGAERASASRPTSRIPLSGALFINSC